MNDGIENRKSLRSLGNGLYVDEKNVLHFRMAEYLKTNLLPDEAAVKTRVWNKLRERFGKDGITEIVDTESEL